MGIELLCALGAGLLAALTGWPVTRLVLRAAAHESGSAHESESAQESGPACEDPAEAAPADGDAAAEPAAASPAEEEAAADGDGTQEGGHATVDNPGLLRGGLAIGLLERFLVAGGIVLGQPGILAVVVAVKGLGRIPELRVSRAAGERFIIGTFASLAWAGALGCAGQLLAGVL